MISYFNVITLIPIYFASEPLSLSVQERMRLWFRDMQIGKAAPKYRLSLGVESSPAERAFSGRRGKKGVAQ